MRMLSLLLIASACTTTEGGTDASTPTDASAADASATDASATDASVPDALASFDAAVPMVCGDAIAPFAPMGLSEPIYLRDSTCQSAPEAPYPSQACVLDLRGHRAADPGTCAVVFAARPGLGDFGEPVRVPRLLPLVVQLPEGAVDPACAQLCARQDAPKPTFGVRILLESEPRSMPRLLARVEPPWLIMAGEETAPSLCHDGYPTFPEFGALSCVLTFGREIDLITADPNPPPARLIVTEDAREEWGFCCLFPRE